MSKWKLIISAVVILVIMAFAAGPTLAGGTNEDRSGDVAWVRIAHASPDAPAVDVWVDGKPKFRDVAFTDVTKYKKLPAGAHKVEVVPAGAQEPVVISADVTLDKDTYYTVAATNVLAKIAPVIYVDDNTRPCLWWWSSKVRFVHLSPDAPAVDIAVSGGGPVIFSNISFTQASDYIISPTGTYSVDVKLAGTDTVVLTIPEVTIKRGRTYTVFAEGLAGGQPPLQVVVAQYKP